MTCEFYTHFAVTFAVTQKELKWLEKSLEELDELRELLSLQEPLPYERHRKTYLITRNLHGSALESELDSLWVPCVSIDSAKQATVFADPKDDVQGRVDTTAAWLSKFLELHNKNTKKDRTIRFAWSYGSSTALPGEFGGGYCIVAKEGWYSICTSDPDLQELVARRYWQAKLKE